MPTDDSQDDLTGLSEAAQTDSMDGLLGALVQAPRLEPPAAEGIRIGRYVLISKLGAGAMGVVWAAYDPQLDRKVALKILRSDQRTRDIGGRERAAREARALAKLIHPNIVAVHDGGIDRDALFVVMEFVDGVTLRAWLAETPRSRDEILDAFGQAAAGLTAAHQAKLVHRDFKPDNVMVGNDGRIRVADFGLARIASAADDGERATGEGIAGGTAGTVTGGFVGTLAFMAPEQMEHGVVDARADQFAFAVSLWTALYGVPPFEGKSMVTRRESIVAGPSAPPGDRGVPAWLHAIVKRGLAARPDDRHPSMSALLAAIERGRGRPRRIAAGLAAVAGLGALVPILWMAMTRPGAAAEPCAGGAAEIATVWTSDRAATITATFPRNPAGQHASERLRERLDGYAGDWATAHREACRATRIDRSQSEDMLERRMACLGRARAGLDAVVAFLGRAGAESENADSVVDGLPRLANCADREALARLVALPDDPATRAEIEIATSRLAALETAIRDSTVTDQSLEAEAALVQARKTGWSPLIAEAEWTHGSSLYAVGRASDAVPAFHEAVRLGLEAGNERMTAFAMADLGRALVEVGSADDARRWLALSRAVAARNGNPDDVVARIAGNSSFVEQRLGGFVDAVADAQASLDLVARRNGLETRQYAAALADLAVAIGTAGRLDEAVPIFDRALAIEIAIHGEGHPGVGNTLSNRAIVHLELGQLDEARRDFERAIAIAVDWFGAEAVQTARPLHGLGMTHLRKGDHDAARAALIRALEILVAHDAPAPDRAELEGNLGFVEQGAGKFAEAIAHGERSLAGLEEALGPNDPMLIPTLLLIGICQRELGRLDGSASSMKRALAIAESAGPNHPWSGSPRTELAETEAARGRHDQAIELCEGVLADDTAGVQFEPFIGPQARMCLGEALWASGRDRPRARRLVAEARDRYLALGEMYTVSFAGAQRWLEEHR